MYILWLEDMRLGFEVPVSFNDDPWELLFMMDTEQVDPYQDGEYTKYFQKGGSLEWYELPEFSENHVRKLEGGEEELVSA